MAQLIAMATIINKSDPDISHTSYSKTDDFVILALGSLDTFTRKYFSSRTNPIPFMFSPQLTIPD